MIQTAENRILTVNGKPFQRKVKTLSFKVYGTQFPSQYSTGLTGSFLLTFFKPQTIKINFNDGNIKSYSSLTASNEIAFRVDNTLANPSHVYTDGNAGERTITIEFEDLVELKGINAYFIAWTGAFPVDIGEAKNIESISLRSLQLNSFPNSLTYLRKIRQWGTRGVLIGNLLPQISEGLFNNPIESLVISSTYDLSDIVSSNFFKIDQLKHTITDFQADYCKIANFPDEIKQCTLLKRLVCDFNNFATLPKEIEVLTNLETLTLGNSVATYLLSGDNSMLDFSLLNKLKTLSIRFVNIIFDDLEVKWAGLLSLANIGGTTNVFFNFVNTTERFDLLISKLYILATTYASIIPGGAAAPYPNRFRNITYGSPLLSFTGEKVAPAGYVQGVSNGTPTTVGQKVYVLQNQYGHLITHGTPII